MKIRYLIAFVALATSTGCAAVRKTGAVAAYATAGIAIGIINGIFDDDETMLERDAREKNERRWKQAWRDNPGINPAMTAAYKDDNE